MRHKETRVLVVLPLIGTQFSLQHKRKAPNTCQSQRAEQAFSNPPYPPTPSAIKKAHRQPSARLNEELGGKT